MDYFQGIVEEFLKDDRAMFVHGELVIDLDVADDSRKGKNMKGRHWFCDVAAVNLRERTLYLGEVTFSRSLRGLVGRLQGWAAVWPDLRAALQRDSAIDPDWAVVPWAFIPAASHALLQRRLESMEQVGSGPNQMPVPRVTYLEDVVPWKHHEWNGRPSKLHHAAQQVVPADPRASRSGG